MQTLDTRHIELFLNEEYKDGSWDYNLIGSHKLQKDTSAACGAIFDLKHVKASASSGKFMPSYTSYLMFLLFSPLTLVHNFLMNWNLYRHPPPQVLDRRARRFPTQSICHNPRSCCSHKVTEKRRYYIYVYINLHNQPSLWRTHNYNSSHI